MRIAVRSARVVARAPALARCAWPRRRVRLTRADASGETAVVLSWRTPSPHWGVSSSTCPSPHQRAPTPCPAAEQGQAAQQHEQPPTACGSPAWSLRHVQPGRSGPTIRPIARGQPPTMGQCSGARRDRGVTTGSGGCGRTSCGRTYPTAATAGSSVHGAAYRRGRAATSAYC